MGPRGHLCSSHQHEALRIPAAAGGEGRESVAPALLTDGRPVRLYLRRTDAALAAARWLSLLTALSGSDLLSCHPPGTRFPGTPAGPASCHPGTGAPRTKRGTGWSTIRSDTSDLEFQQEAVKYRCQPVSFLRVFYCIMNKDPQELDFLTPAFPLFLSLKYCFDDRLLVILG